MIKFVTLDNNIMCVGKKYEFWKCILKTNVEVKKFWTSIYRYNKIKDIGQEYNVRYDKYKF